MTTFHDVDRRCHVCGETSSQTTLGSSNAFGSPDLDTRPPEMIRSTLHVQIEVCPACNYCAPDISRGPTTARATVISAGYKIEAAARAVPPLARDYLCHGLVAAAAGDLRSAAWSALRAAWACDDARNLDIARNCRRLAA